MAPQDYLLLLFCLIDEELKALAPEDAPARRRGPAPKLSDAEVITIEIAAESWGHDADRDIFRFFRHYHRADFPALLTISRTTFARQAANLWRVKQLIQARLAGRLTDGQSAWLIDSMLLPARRFGRPTFCSRFDGQVDYGRDTADGRTF